jgi:hypothetical protein
MDEDVFWAMVQRCHDVSSGDMKEKCKLVIAEIARLSAEDALAFHQIFQRMMDAAYAWPLWGAAYVANGGCGDDSFSDFRASLISRGRAAYENALADPDSLADDTIYIDSWFYEGFQYAITDGVKAKIGKRPTRAFPHPRSPAGTPWPEKTVCDLYPRLMQKVAAS